MSRRHHKSKALLFNRSGNVARVVRHRAKKVVDEVGDTFDKVPDSEEPMSSGLARASLRRAGNLQEELMQLKIRHARLRQKCIVLESMKDDAEQQLDHERFRIRNFESQVGMLKKHAAELKKRFADEMVSVCRCERSTSPVESRSLNTDDMSVQRDTATRDGAFAHATSDAEVVDHGPLSHRRHRGVEDSNHSDADQANSLIKYIFPKVATNLSVNIATQTTIARENEARLPPFRTCSSSSQTAALFPVMASRGMQSESFQDPKPSTRSVTCQTAESNRIEEDIWATPSPRYHFPAPVLKMSTSTQTEAFVEARHLRTPQSDATQLTVEMALMQRDLERERALCKHLHQRLLADAISVARAPLPPSSTAAPPQPPRKSTTFRADYDQEMVRVSSELDAMAKKFELLLEAIPHQQS